MHLQHLATSIAVFLIQTFDGLQGLKSELPICEDSVKIAKLFNEGVLFVPKASNLLKRFFELVNCLMKGCYLCLKASNFLIQFFEFYYLQY